MENKVALRQYLRSVRKMHDASDEESIIKNAQTMIDGSSYNVVGFYSPMHGDPNILLLSQLNTHIEFALPKIIEQQMVFVRYKFGDQMEPSATLPRLQEPASCQILIPELLFVPGLAFDLRGYRLGLGSGHYDKYLAKSQHIQTIGVCFNNNLLECLPSEDHDCRMRFVITEHLILKL
jgi:5-formyltetrahydrofolate cyclo-ligase